MFGALVFASWCAAAPSGDVVDLRALEQSIQKSVARAEPSVVSVLVSRRQPPTAWRALVAADANPEYFGGGVVIDHRLVLTCYHLVREAGTLAVRLPPIKPGEPARTSGAEIYAADVRSDLAVLRLTSQDLVTPAIELGKGEELTKGSFLVGLGSAYNPEFTDGAPAASWGVVSNFRRRSPGSSRKNDRPGNQPWYANLLQADTRLGFGISGAAWIDPAGRLVGLSTAVVSPGTGDAGSYAITIDAAARRIIDVLRKGQEVEYGMLGVTTMSQPRFPRNFDPEPFRAARIEGAHVSGVVRNGPADLAGIQPGDTIVAVEGQSCTDFDELYIQVGACLAGREAAVKFYRGGRPQTVRVTLGKWHNPEFGIATNRPDPVEGLRVDYVSIASSSSDRAWARGVVVREIQKDSAASRHDLTEMVDIITAVNGEPVTNPNDFYRLAERVRQTGEPLQLLVVRPGELGGSRPVGIFGVKVEAARIVTLKPGVADRPVVVVAELSRSRVSAPTKLREFVDVITAVDGTTVQTPEDYYRVAESAAGARRAIQLSLINPERTISLP